MEVGDKITQELKNDMVCSYNELSEVLSDFDDLSEKDIIGLLPTIKKRVSDAQFFIGKYLSEDDVLDEI